MYPDEMQGLLGQWAKLQRPNQIGGIVQPSTTSVAKPIFKPTVAPQLNKEDLAFELLQKQFRKEYPTGDPNLQFKNHSAEELFGDYNTAEYNRKPGLLDISYELNNTIGLKSGLANNNDYSNYEKYRDKIIDKPLSNFKPWVQKQNERISIGDNWSKLYTNYDNLSSSQKKSVDKKEGFYKNQLVNKVKEIEHYRDLMNQEVKDRKTTLLFNHPGFMDYAMQNITNSLNGVGLPPKSPFEMSDEQREKWGKIYPIENTQDLHGIIKEQLINNFTNTAYKTQVAQMFKDNGSQNPVKDTEDYIKKMVGHVSKTDELSSPLTANGGADGNYYPAFNAYNIGQKWNSTNPGLWFHEYGHATNIENNKLGSFLGKEKQTYDKIQNDTNLITKLFNSGAFTPLEKDDTEYRIQNYILSPEELGAEKRKLELHWRLKYGVKPGGKFTHEMYDHLISDKDNSNSRFKYMPFETVRDIWEKTR